MLKKKIIDEFIEDQRLSGKAEGTLREYRQRLEGIFQFFENENITLKSVIKADLTAYIQTKQRECLKTSTIVSKLSTFRVLNIWAVKKGYMDSLVISPDDYPKNVKVKRVRRLSDDDLRVFKAYIDKLRPNVRAAFWLMLGSGCRVGEAAHLRPIDISLRGKAVYVDIHEAKWGSDRCIPIVEAEAAKIVWQYREELEVDNRPLFRLSKRTLQGYATAFAKKTGITFRCHLLRHTFAGLLTEQGIPLTTTQYLLGHKSLAMTSHYAQSALTDLTQIEAKI